MKQLLFILFFTSYLNTIFANDNFEFPALEKNPSSPKVQLDTHLTPDRYSYFTLGSSVLLQEVGVGSRYRNFKNFKGHDLGFNMKFPLPIILGSLANPRYLGYPSIKYTYLNYKNNSATSPYFGVACEVYMLNKKRKFSSFKVLPNIGLIWGKEEENIRFSQLQLNVVPAVGLIVGTGLALSGSAWERAGGEVLALASASVLVSYSAGF